MRSVASSFDDGKLRSMLGAFLFSGDDVYKKIEILSGGEKSRLALLKILIQETNFLILDEPTNHLDLKTKKIFQEALTAYKGTVLIVSHDRFFLDNLVERIIEIKEGKATENKGNYSYYIEKRVENSKDSHFKISKEKMSSKNGSKLKNLENEIAETETKKLNMDSASEVLKIEAKLKKLYDKWEQIVESVAV